VRTSGERTIFRDEYTHAEVWRLTNDPQGVNRHDYSAFPAWNANGRWIKISRQGMPTFIDQETGVLYQPLPVVAGQWSTTEPDILFTGSEWNGARAIVAYDFAQRKVVRGIGPVREYAGISPISADGKWVCWREGIQDDATTFGLGAADGSSYKSILLNGGIVTEQTPVTFALPGPQPSVQETRGGVHQMYFTRSPDHRIIVGSNSYDPRLFIDRIYTPDGRLVMTITETLSHVSWHPEGQFAIFCGEGGLGQFDPDTGRRWPILTVKENIEAHTTWTSYDPHWAGASFRTPFAGEVLRVSMDPDHSVARLCGSCPLNPDTTAYDNDEFACLSPDGTKVLFMSTMSGSVNEYLVVAANPRPPKLSGEWTPDGYRLTWTPDALSREIKGYRIYRTNRSGQDYRDIAGPVEGTGYVVTGLKKGEGAFFAVRAQEWSGLISRYSNEVSADGQPTAAYLEAETCPFTGFKQGFDPEGASDLYYLFVPKDGVKCSVTLTLPGKAGDVWIRVAGQGAAFTTTATGKPHPKSEIRNPKSEIRRDPGWTWVNLGRQAGAVTITSESGGFKIDRVFITPTRQTPTGRGLDYQPRADFQAPAEVRVQANGPFAATVTWKPITGARYYNVHASDRPDFTPAQSNLLYSPPAGTERAVDWGLKPGATYYYRVVAVDYDGTESPASEPAKCQTEVLDVKTVEIEYEAGTVGSGAQVEDDPTASGGRSVLLNKDQTYELRFRVPAEGDYVIWHQYRGDSGAAVTGQVVLDGKPFPWQETYDQAALYGQALGPVWVWHRYRFRWGEQANGILPLTAGEHILSLSIDHPIHLDQLVLTNDLSYVPEGRLCTF
jgi:hypothetical protein